MPRSFFLKIYSQIKRYPPELLKYAVDRLKTNEIYLLAAAKEHGVPRSTICRHTPRMLQNLKMTTKPISYESRKRFGGNFINFF